MSSLSHQQHAIHIWAGGFESATADLVIQFSRLIAFRQDAKTKAVCVLGGNLLISKLELLFLCLCPCYRDDYRHDHDEMSFSSYMLYIPIY